MTSQQKKVLGILAILATGMFLAFALPNSRGARDVAMISIFEPDEYAQYSHPIRMLTPAKTFVATLHRFVFYQHYYYGYPFYLFSAGVLAVLKMLAGLGSVQWNMLLLRQMVSVFPMLLAIVLLVYLHTEFKSYLVSIGLFLFLATLPGVVKNNLWWHPDGLTILFVVLVFFFLQRDRLRFKENFYFAAIACGTATGTKLIGLFFFLTIPWYLFLGVREKAISLRQGLLHALGFVAAMFGTAVLLNPVLFFPQGRAAVWKIQTRQAEAMSFGWDVAYRKGIQGWLPVIREAYGTWPFFLALGLALGIVLKEKSTRRLNQLILTWSIPFLVYVILRIVIHPVHFLLPVALPLYSILGSAGMVLLSPQTLKIAPSARRIVMGIILGGVLLQGGHNLQWDWRAYQDALYKERDNPSIQFYQNVKRSVLSVLEGEENLTAYRDVRVYFPDDSSFSVRIKWGGLTYAYLNDHPVGLIALWQQRILDYTNRPPDPQAPNYADAKAMYDFYLDARRGEIRGYVEVYTDDFGKVFVRKDLFERYFQR